MGACGSGPEKGEIAIVEGFAGLVAGEEPRAVAAGRTILGNGGTAADAAVTMYFTMAVTMPSRAGLGSGGLCIAFSGDRADGRAAAAEVYDFPAGHAGAKFQAPLAARAMALMHARQGVRRWESLLAEGEQLARFGHPVSRAFARDIQDAAGIIMRDEELRESLSNRAGGLAREGDVIVQEELSTAIGGIRSQGAGYLYTGPFAKRFAGAVSSLGQTVTAEELRVALPRIVEPLRVSLGKDVAYFAPPRAAGGLVSAQMWGMLTEVEDFEDANPSERAHLLAEAALTAFADRTAWLEPGGATRKPVDSLLEEDYLEKIFVHFDPQTHKPAADYDPPPAEIVSDPYSAGFIVADRWGDAVACSFTMGGLFGSGQMIPGTGIVLSAPADPAAANLTPLIVGNESTGDLRFAATVSGGLAAPAALVQIMLLAIEDEQTLAQAVAAPRVAQIGLPDVVFAEPGLSPEVRSGLESRGHEVAEAPVVGVVSVLHCPGGILDQSNSCQIVADGRGFGMALRAQ